MYVPKFLYLVSRKQYCHCLMDNIRAAVDASYIISKSDNKSDYFLNKWKHLYAVLFYSQW